MGDTPKNNNNSLIKKDLLSIGAVDDITSFLSKVTNEDNSIKSETKLLNKSFGDNKYSGLSLFKYNYEELPKLIEPIFPKVGLASLVGSSDTGKSTFLRQLALSIALNLEDFVGYKTDTRTRNVIYISTEDDPASTSISLKKQIKGLHKSKDLVESNLNHIKFIFDFNLNENNDANLFSILNSDLETFGADLIIVDAFTDIFNGDINSSTKVREFLNQFSALAKRNNCLVLFLHHTGKRTDKFTASKDNVLGSQAFEAKMRVLIELKQYPNDDTKRTLTITKGNYLSSHIKKYSKVLKFDEEELLFYDEGQILTTSIATLSKTYIKKDEALAIIKKLKEDKKSIRQIEAELKANGFNIGKSTVSNYMKEIK